VSSTTAEQWREMARRAGDGIEVALLWNGSLNLVKVMVSDGRLCHHLDFEVARADTFSAFRKQFADAASRLPEAELQADLSERLSRPSDQGD
jgi:hypothetical protein